jgi:ribonucleoside-triphosphate reductase
MIKYGDFSLEDGFLDSYRGTQPEWGPLGYFTYKRTYARELPDGNSEEFWQTCKRVVEGVYSIQKQHCQSLHLPWSDSKAQRSAQEMYRRMWEFKFLPPGRGLWVMGTEVVPTKGGAALNNCAFISTENIDKDFSWPFCFLMDMSMLGVGVGGDARGAGKVTLSPLEVDDEETFEVQDSREGWVDLIRVVLNSYAGKRRMPGAISYDKVRPHGAKLGNFGGVSSGPGPLKALVENISKLLGPVAAEGKAVGTTEIVDLFNYIGKCVVSGGIRRTAEIMFSDLDDKEFLDLKQDQEALYDRRWASNNSVFGEVGMDYSEIAERIAHNGEPGIIWLENMRMYSRTRDELDGKDYRVMGSNPCAEQSLESGELCCLVETFPAQHESLEDWVRTLKYAYLYAKTVTLVPTHVPLTNAVTMRNRRIGCSQSGIIQAINKFGRRNYLDHCDMGFDYIQELDGMYSEWLCIPKSIKTTSIKPSGTVSLLVGATPGIHYPHSEYYIRNIRVDSTSPLLQAARDAGHPVEKDKYADNTWVVSFPVKEENFSRSKDDVSIWDQFANAADLQAYWADNQVSITVTFREDEVPSIVPCLEHFESKLKSISMLPISDHKYEQAPYIKITEEEYYELKNKITGDIATSGYVHEKEDEFCDGDSCEIDPLK